LAAARPLTASLQRRLRSLRSRVREAPFSGF
jgi:hypothetical protein